MKAIKFAAVCLSAVIAMSNAAAASSFVADAAPSAANPVITDIDPRLGESNKITLGALVYEIMAGKDGQYLEVVGVSEKIYLI